MSSFSRTRRSSVSIAATRTADKSVAKPSSPDSGLASPTEVNQISLTLDDEVGNDQPQTPKPECLFLRRTDLASSTSQCPFCLASRPSKSHLLRHRPHVFVTSHQAACTVQEALFSLMKEHNVGPAEAVDLLRSRPKLLQFPTSTMAAHCMYCQKTLMNNISPMLHQRTCPSRLYGLCRRCDQLFEDGQKAAAHAIKGNCLPPMIILKLIFQQVQGSRASCTSTAASTSEVPYRERSPLAQSRNRCPSPIQLPLPIPSLAAPGGMTPFSSSSQYCPTAPECVKGNGEDSARFCSPPSVVPAKEHLSSPPPASDPPLIELLYSDIDEEEEDEEEEARANKATMINGFITSAVLGGHRNIPGHNSSPTLSGYRKGWRGSPERDLNDLFSAYAEDVVDSAITSVPSVSATLQPATFPPPGTSARVIATQRILTRETPIPSEVPSPEIFSAISLMCDDVIQTAKSKVVRDPREVYRPPLPDVLPAFMPREWARNQHGCSRAVYVPLAGPRKLLLLPLDMVSTKRFSRRNPCRLECYS